MLVTVVTGIATLVSNWITGKQRIQEAKIEAQVKQASQDGDWDKAAVDQMQFSWKDEWFTILLSVPTILAFCGPSGRRWVAEGFEALKGMPDWYAYAFLTAVAASFGIRKLVDLAASWKK